MVIKPMHQKIEIDGVEQHPAKYVTAETAALVSTVTGWNVRKLPDKLESEAPIPGTGINLQLSSQLSKDIRDGFELSLGLDVRGYFGDSYGSSNVTSLKQSESADLKDVIRSLHRTGQLGKVRSIVDASRTPDDPPAELVVTYALATYAKGWIAEETVASRGWFKKGSVSQDEGGIDGYVMGDPAQLGSITRWNSRRTEIENSDVLQFLYQWDSGGELHVGTPEEILAVNKEIADAAGLSSTLTKRWHDGLKINEELGRGFRYLWW